MSKQIALFLLILTLSSNLIAQNKNTYNEVTLPELMRKKQQGDNNMVIVDVRTKGEYYDTTSIGKQSNIGHIKGAINISVQELDQNPNAVKQLDQYKDKDIYLICSHSYRSRVASNILLRNGFTDVNNVRGGMTEWYRRYEDLAPYRKELETANHYTNLGSGQLANYLLGNKDVTLIAISSVPGFFYDSLVIDFYKYFPAFKKAVYFNYADSLKVLETARKAKGPVVLFNIVNYGAAELTEWLTAKGISNASFLVGSVNYFYEYTLNKKLEEKLSPFLTRKSDVHFITPAIYCDNKSSFSEARWIDIRHDTVFTMITEGAKHNYKHMTGALSFYEKRGIAKFVEEFPDKTNEYIFISQNGINGLELAAELTKKGYKIAWLMGGYFRWEWYMNNMETFTCNNELEK